MSGNATRLEIISSIASGEPVDSMFPFKEVPTSELWGDNVFSLAMMAQRLPKSV